MGQGAAGTSGSGSGGKVATIRESVPWRAGSDGGRVTKATVRTTNSEVSTPGP